MAPKVKDALPVGFQLRSFEIGAPLGQGGFGITYTARHMTLGHAVAIKEYLPMEVAARDGSPVELIAENPTLMKRPVIDGPQGLTLGWSAEIESRHRG